MFTNERFYVVMKFLGSNEDLARIKRATYEYGSLAALNRTCIVHLAYRSITVVLITFFSDAAHCTLVRNSLLRTSKENVSYFVSKLCNRWRNELVKKLLQSNSLYEILHPTKFLKLKFFKNKTAYKIYTVNYYKWSKI